MNISTILTKKEKGPKRKKGYYRCKKPPYFRQKTV